MSNFEPQPSAASNISQEFENPTAEAFCQELLWRLQWFYGVLAEHLGFDPMHMPRWKERIDAMHSFIGAVMSSSPDDQVMLYLLIRRLFQKYEEGLFANASDAEPDEGEKVNGRNDAEDDGDTHRHDEPRHPEAEEKGDAHVDDELYRSDDSDAYTDDKSDYSDSEAPTTPRYYYIDEDEYVETVDESARTVDDLEMVFDLMSALSIDREDLEQEGYIFPA